MSRFNFNASQSAWEERHLPLLKSLYGDAPPPETVQTLSAFDLHCRMLFGKSPISEAERYAAAEAVEHAPVLTGRGED
jgi:hypothetical protein